MPKSQAHQGGRWIWRKRERAEENGATPLSSLSSSFGGGAAGPGSSDELDQLWRAPWAFLAQHETRRLKENSRRKVLACATQATAAPTGWLLIKATTYTTICARVRAVFKCDPLSRAWHNAQHAWRRGAPAAPILALGVRWSGGLPAEAMLVGLFEPGALPLIELAQSHTLNPAQRRVVLKRSAQVAAALHRAGLEHLDFHAGNLLVTSDLRVVPIDLDRARWWRGSGGVPWQQRVRNLGFLAASLWFFTTARERAAFIHAYVEEVGDWRSWCKTPSQARVSLARAVAGTAMKLMRKIWRRRAQIPLGDNRMFHPIDTGTFHGWLRRSYECAELEQFAQAPQNVPLPIRFSIQCLDTRPNEVRRRWLKAYALQMRGVKTLDTVMALVSRAKPQAWLVTAGLPCALPIDEYVIKQTRLNWSALQQRRFNQELARWLGQLHTHSVYLGGTLPQVTEIGAGWEFWITELDHAQIGKQTRRDDCVKDLVLLELAFWGFLTPQARMRFWLAYARAQSWACGKELHWARRINRAVQRAVLARLSKNDLAINRFYGGIVDRAGAPLETALSPNLTSEDKPAVKGANSNPACHCTRNTAPETSARTAGS